MNKKIKIIVFSVLVIMLLAFLKLLCNQNLSSVEDFQDYLKKFGLWAPIVLCLFQAFQVVVPVVPGYLGCVAGAVAFGPCVGFLSNYIGISIGSIIAFFLAEHYGIKIVLTMFSEKLYYKWKGRIEQKKSYDVFLFVATLLPLFPDDFLCYFSGLIKMNAKKFIWIIILGKPWCILLYSLIFGFIK